MTLMGSLYRSRDASALVLAVGGVQCAGGGSHLHVGSAAAQEMALLHQPHWSGVAAQDQ